MLTLTNTHVDEDEGFAVKSYSADMHVALARDSIWSNTKDKVVHVTGVTVVEEGDCVSVYVKHNATWDIYTDTGFERAISEAVGFAVKFTEQGMQEDGVASLEA
jgi:hypothetical protein